MQSSDSGIVVPLMDESIKGANKDLPPLQSDHCLLGLKSININNSQQKWIMQYALH